MTSTLTGWNNEKRPVQRGYPPAIVQEYCVQNREWQKFRLSLKGIPTHEKLSRLEKYWDDWFFIFKGTCPIRIEVQVGNYLRALRRGGQLSADNQIRKYI